MSDQFVKDPAAIVTVQQKVKVTVLEVDIQRKRIALSMKSNPLDEKVVTPKRKSDDGKKKHSKSSPMKKEESMEDKLAQLRDKFRK